MQAIRWILRAPADLVVLGMNTLVYCIESRVAWGIILWALVLRIGWILAYGP